MGQDPDQIRQEIEATRSRMEETVEAIGHRADVRARSKERLSSARSQMVGGVTRAKDRAVESIVGTKESATGRLSNTTSGVADTTASAGEFTEVVRRKAGLAQENPLGLALGSFALGFIAGMFIPSTKIEQEKVGPLAEQVRDKVQETGQEALERGKQVVEQIPQATEQARQAASESVIQSAQEQASELASSTKERAKDISSG